jgi:hypothetical protein
MPRLTQGSIVQGGAVPPSPDVEGLLESDLFTVQGFTEGPYLADLHEKTLTPEQVGLGLSYFAAGVHNVMAYGAVGDGVTDDTAAIQEAVDAAAAQGGGVVWFPHPTVYYLVTTGNILVGGDKIRFEGDRGTRVVADGTANMFVLGDVSHARSGLIFRNLRLTSDPSAGHIFSVPLGINHCTFDECTLEIQGTTKSVLYSHSNGSIINNQFLYCDVVTQAASTVPAWIDIANGAGGANCNTIQGGRHTAIGAVVSLGNGVPPIHFESNAVGNYTYDNVFREILFEVPTNGCIRILSGMGNLIDGCTSYDLPVGGTVQHLVIVGAGAGNLASFDNTIRDFKQRGTPLGTGMKCVNLVLSKASRTILSGCRAIAPAAFVVDNNFNSGTVFRDCYDITVEDHAPASAGQQYAELTVNGGFGTALGSRVQWSNGPALYAGKGSPEGVITAEVGSVFLRHDGGYGSAAYSKETGTGNTGWRALSGLFGEVSILAYAGGVDIFDGASHPLSGLYASLAAAQVDYPHATALTNELAGIALQAAINALPAAGGTITAPAGVAFFNTRVDWGYHTTFRGVWGGQQEGTGGASNYGTQFRWNGATNSTLWRIFDKQNVHLDGFVLHGGSVAGCTALLIDSDNGGGGAIVTTHQIHVEHFSIEFVGVADSAVAGQDGIGISIGTSGVTAYQSDGIVINDFSILTTAICIKVNSGNAMDYSTIRNGRLVRFNRGIWLAYSPFMHLLSLAFASAGAAMTHFNGSTSDVACVYISGASGTLLVSQCQGENSGYTLIVDAAASAMSDPPITLLTNHFNRPLDIRAQRRITSVGNHYGDDFTIASQTVVHSFGDIFGAGKGFIASGGNTNVVRIGELGHLSVTGDLPGVTLDNTLVHKVVSLGTTGNLTPVAKGGTVNYVGPMTGNVTIISPSAPVEGQMLMFEFEQGAGGHTVTWGAQFKRTWSDTGNTAGLTSSAQFVRIGSYWRQIGAQRAWA